MFDVLADNPVLTLFLVVGPPALADSLGQPVGRRLLLVGRCWRCSARPC
jgi:hypothetical protein